MARYQDDFRDNRNFRQQDRNLGPRQQQGRRRGRGWSDETPYDFDFQQPDPRLRSPSRFVGKDSWRENPSHLRGAARGRGQERVRDWWMGGPQRGQEAGYDDPRYRRFHESAHPRFSPIGGMYPEMGGSQIRRGSPSQLRYDRWFSDWTRWF